MSSFRVGVGSTNPVKVAAAREAASEVLRFHHDTRQLEMVAMEVASGVSLQPMTDAETRSGARQRAQNVLTTDPTLDLAIGLEGGVMEDPEDGRLYTTVWICALSQDGRVGLAGGGRIVVPAKVAAGVRAGGEMGPLIDDILNRTNTKHAGGLFGEVTQGVVPRQREYQEIAVIAVALWWTGETELGAA